MRHYALDDRDIEAAIARARTRRAYKGAAAALSADPAAVLRDPKLQPVEAMVAHADAAAAQGARISDQHLARAYRQTAPILKPPTLDDPIDDVPKYVLSQPHVQRAFGEWWGPPPARSSKPDYTEAKLALLYQAVGDGGQHVNKQRSVVERLESWQEKACVIQLMARERHRQQLALPGFEADYFNPRPRLYSYPTLRVHMPRLAGEAVATSRFWVANVEMLKELRKIHDGVARHLTLDASAYPAWVPQRGGNSWRDHFYRRNIPDAGYRAYAYDAIDKKSLGDVQDGQWANLVTSKRVKIWRGFYVVLISCQLTGLPIIGVMHDAAVNEHEFVPALLQQLLELWPDLDADWVAGDAGWDIKEVCQSFQTAGIAPIFRFRSRPRTGEREGEVGSTRITNDSKIQLVDAAGRLWCPHGITDFVSYEQAGPAAHHHTVRVDCPNRPPAKAGYGQIDPHGNFCGRMRVPMEANWRRILAYPNYAHGRPDLYALRLAALARLTRTEAIWSSMKQIGLGTDGPDRNRCTDINEHATLVALWAMSKTAATLSQQQALHGASPIEAVPGEPGPSGIHTSQPSQQRRPSPCHGGRRHRRPA